MSVSGNDPTPIRNPEVLHEYSLLLRAVVAPVTATGLLYRARAYLEEPTNPAGRAVNKTLCNLVADMLAMPEAEPDLVERVLRNLP
jgi:hypothetical protein